jgi:hypothetical protein
LRLSKGVATGQNGAGKTSLPPAETVPVRPDLRIIDHEYRATAEEWASGIAARP